MYFNNPNRNPNPYFVYDSLICQCQDLTCRVPLGSMIISFPSLTIVSANPTIQNPKKQGKADFMFIIFLIISAYTAHPVDSFKSTFLLVRGFSIFSRRREYCPALYRVVFKPELNKEEGSGFLRNLTVGFPGGKPRDKRFSMAAMDKLDKRKTMVTSSSSLSLHDSFEFSVETKVKNSLSVYVASSLACS